VSDDYSKMLIRLLLRSVWRKRLTKTVTSLTESGSYWVRPAHVFSVATATQKYKSSRQAAPALLNPESSILHSETGASAPLFRGNALAA
jgi:hypothetical protein